jgi:lipopolysaccharide transport system ATP-binding protein
MTAVVAEEISKRYRINIGPAANTLGGRLRGMLSRNNVVMHEDIWALRDVSFDVEQGEVFGIIGRNGSGKSTLLKILTGIVRPTYGSAAIRGRVGALLEVGTGFHPDLTGRENVYFNGTLLGLDRTFIDSKFDEIVQFAEIGKFIDTQFKHYSSGMQARLGFAVAVNLRPEVLILDEVLSVGDLMFQEKSMDRMTELRRSGITILFVSHSLGTVAGICKRAMLLRQGRVIKIGEVGQVVEEYVPKVSSGTAFVDFGEGSNFPATFLTVATENGDGVRSDHFDIGEDILLRLRYRVRKPQGGLQLAVVIRIQQDDVVQTFDTDDHAFLGRHEVGTFEKVLKIPRMFLKEGEYSVRLTIGIPTLCYDDYEAVLKFSVTADSMDTSNKSFRRGRAGKVVFPGSWQDTVIDQQSVELQDS